MAITSKICSVCHNDKPLSEFHRHASHRGGVRANCISCRKASDEYRKTGLAAQARRAATFLIRHPERAERSCRECGKAFVPRRVGGTLQVFCSKKCNIRDSNRLRVQRHPERVRAWWDAHPGYGRQHGERRKRSILDAYGGARCVCCGETHLDFLTVDHIGGWGARHRKEIGAAALYPWLIKNGFPPGFRVLCMNCNFAMRHGRRCPHAADREVAS